MNSRIRRSIVGLVLACTQITRPALACTCAEGTGTLSERLQNYQAVFLGTVVEMRAIDLSPSPYPVDRVLSVEVTLKLREAWKGVDASKTTVVVISDVGLCGFPFQFGEAYLVSATLRDGKLHADLCSLTKGWEHAGAELSWLRQSTKQ